MPDLTREMEGGRSREAATGGQGLKVQVPRLSPDSCEAVERREGKAPRFESRCRRRFLLKLSLIGREQLELGLDGSRREAQDRGVPEPQPADGTTWCRSSVPAGSATTVDNGEPRREFQARTIVISTSDPTNPGVSVHPLTASPLDFADLMIA